MSKAQIRRELPHQPLTPIPCEVCGWEGKGRWANRSTVCWSCRRRIRKAIEQARVTPSIKLSDIRSSSGKVRNNA